MCIVFADHFLQVQFLDIVFGCYSLHGKVVSLGPVYLGHYVLHGIRAARGLVLIGVKTLVKKDQLGLKNGREWSGCWTWHGGIELKQLQGMADVYGVLPCWRRLMGSR